jgi:hypothetical protein
LTAKVSVPTGALIVALHVEVQFTVIGVPVEPLEFVTAICAEAVADDTYIVERVALLCVVVVVVVLAGTVIENFMFSVPVDVAVDVILLGMLDPTLDPPPPHAVSRRQSIPAASVVYLCRSIVRPLS